MTEPRIPYVFVALDIPRSRVAFESMTIRSSVLEHRKKKLQRSTATMVLVHWPQRNQQRVSQPRLTSRRCRTLLVSQADEE
jgi:hypothetical protein